MFLKSNPWHTQTRQSDSFYFHLIVKLFKESLSTLVGLGLVFVGVGWRGVEGFTQVFTTPPNFITSVPSLLSTGGICPPGTRYCVNGECREQCTEPSRLQTKCSEGEVFCLASGRCVQKDNGCSFPGPTVQPTTSHCIEDQVFCLQRGTCVPRGTNCNEGGGETRPTVQGKCTENEVFCLASGKCQPKEGCGKEMEKLVESVQTKCSSDQYFCLQRGRCVSISGGCEGEQTPPTPTSETHSKCGEEEYFCLQRNRCVPRVRDCGSTGDDGVDSRCGTGEVYCMTTDRCIPRGESCEGGSGGGMTTHKCEDDEYFCLQKGRCLPKQGSCDSRGSQTTTAPPQVIGDSCTEGQVFCLKSGRCVERDTNCATPSPYMCDPQQEYYCPARGGCVKNSEPCLGPPTTVSPSPASKCPPNQVFCLASARCVERTCTGKEDKLVPTSTNSPPSAGARLLLVDRAVTVYDTVQFRLSQYVPQSRSLKQQYTARLSCNQTSGVRFYAGRAVLGEMDVDLSQLITVTTDGEERGVVTCRVLSLPPDIDMEFQYIGIVAIPKTATPTVSMVMTSTNVTEGVTHWMFDEWDKMFHVNISDEVPEIVSDKEIVSSENVTEIYREGLESMAGRVIFPLRVALYRVPMDSRGLPVASLVTRSEGEFQWRRVSSKGVVLDDEGYGRTSKSLYVKIHPAYSGEIRFVLTLNSGDQFMFTLMILAVNNAPYLTSPEKTMDTLSSVLVQPYSGAREFTAGEISDLVFTDEDRDVLGLALLGTVSEELGSWHYDSGDGWRPVPVLGRMTPHQQQNVSVVLLSNVDKLKFVPTVGYLWSTREALRKTKLYTLAWDGSDLTSGQRSQNHILIQKCSAMMKMCGEGGHSAYSSEIIPLFMNKAGCDGQPGSQLGEDLCGVCGGYDDCVDCNGKLNGGAVIDACGDCTEGDTGLTRDHRLDCRGQCGLNYYDDTLNMCLPNNVDIQKLMTLFQECDGRINSDAYINKCGHCVLGNTTLAENHGEDQCGVCDGEDECVDCAGVPFGESVMDFCDVCLLRNSSDYNKECYVGMGHINQTSFGASGQKALEMTAYTMAQEEKEDRPSALIIKECGLYKRSYWNLDIPMSVLSYDNNTGVIVAQTRLLTVYDSGVYSIGCYTHDEGIDTIQSPKTTQIVIFGPANVRRVFPQQIKVQEGTKVTVKGIRFFKSGYVKCAIKCPYTERGIGCFTTDPEPSGFMIFPAKRLDESTCECDLKKMSKVTRPMPYDLTVLLEPITEYSVPGLKYVKLFVKAPAPRLVSARFDKMYCSVTVLFDVSVEGPNNCTDLFEETSFQKLGENAECYFMGNRLIILLKRGEFSLRPGEHLLISNSTILKMFSGEKFPAFASGSILVKAPKKQMQISADLIGGGVIGSCDPFELFLRKSGSLGCVDIAFNWTVTSNDSNPSALVLSDINDLQRRLDDMPASQWRFSGQGSEIVPGSTYVFTAVVSNMLDLTFTSVSAHVTRSQGVKPISVQLQVLSRKHPDPQKPLKMAAMVTPSACSGINMVETRFLYKWTSSSADVVIASVMELPFAVIRSGSLRGGSSYTITVTVFKQNDESVSAEASVTFSTLSQPLEVRIPPYIQSLPTAPITLDASRSSDPDNIPDKPRFYWACTKESIPGAPYYIKRDKSEVMLESLVRPSSPETPSLTIPPDTLPTGRYIWNVTMMKGKRSRSKSVVLEIVDNRAPLIVMDTTDLTVNSGEAIRLSSVISTYNKKPVKVFWECGHVEGYDYVSLENHTSNPSRLVQEMKEPLRNYVFSLYLDKGLPSGGMFSLEVTAIAGESMLSRTERVKVTVNSPPMIGEVKISPLNGTALSTKFEVMFGEGWIDPEGDKVMFYVHTQKVGEKKICRMNARSVTDVVSYDLMLGKGEFLVHIEACDLQQACVIYTVPSTIQVSEKEMSEAEINTTVSDVTQLLKTDMDKAVGMAVTLTSVMGDGNGSKALGGVMNDVAYNLLSSSSAEFAPVEAVTVMDTANTILKPMAEGGMLTNKVRGEGLLKANQLASTVRSQPGQERQRRRRAVDPNSLTTVTVNRPMSESEAETILTSYSLLHMGKSEDQITTEEAEDYLTALDNIKIGVCAGITYAEDAIVVDNELTTLRVQKTTTATLATEMITVTCENCTISQTAYVMYGAEISEEYHHWNCSVDLQCYGACFTSAQMMVDMVTATSPQRFAIDFVRRSDLISLQMINPTTHNLMTVEGLSVPVTVQVPIMGNYNESAHSLQCNMWLGSNWTNDDCVSSSPEFMADGFHVNCTCNRLGVIGVFEGPVVIESTTVLETTTQEETTVTTEMTTMKTTTTTTPKVEIPITFVTEANIDQNTQDVVISKAVKSTTTTKSPPVPDSTTPVNSVSVPAYAGKVYILFALHDNFATIVAGQENSFRLHIMQILTSYLKIPASRITNLQVEEVKNDDDDAGSITIKFEVFSRALDSEPTMGEIIFQLREAIRSGSLVVTSTTGQRLVVDTNSFAWSTSELRTEIDSGANYTMFIVSGAVGAFVLIIIMTGIVIYLIKTKANKSQQVTQSPTPYGPNMQGVDVPRPMVGKTNSTSGNWVETEANTVDSVSDADTYRSYSAKPLSRLPPIQ
ncbi:uncharacterized protein LOC134277467 [Saccostrea cucullata]|uniref:uncharacterized protein LOC134277467 n=1 Tax=Saccostrea cuccullata TaxID=36930 RepID=UPI002ED2A25A